MKYPRIVEGFVVKHTGAKGYGFYADKDYKKGELLCKVTGTRMTDKNPKLSHRAIQIERGKTPSYDLFIEPRRFSIIWYLNHSCSPNAYFDHDSLYARKPIKKGEEITADYSLFTNYHTWNMECLCGHNSCRKMIEPFDKLKKLSEDQKKFVSGYLKK